MSSVIKFLPESIEAGVIPNCKCGKPAGANRQNKKGQNRYRWFFCCNPIEIYQNCGFFQWIPDNKEIIGCNLVEKNLNKK